jgi:hypothetical protein
MLLAIRTWDRGAVEDDGARRRGEAYSCRLSIRVLFEPRDLWLGAYWKRGYNDLQVYLCLLPMLPIRLHFQRSYGGRFPRRRGFRGLSEA